MSLGTRPRLTVLLLPTTALAVLEWLPGHDERTGDVLLSTRLFHFISKGPRGERDCSPGKDHYVFLG